MKNLETFEELNEMALVNKPEDSLSSKQYKVYVYGQERNQTAPHFHFLDKIEEKFHVEIQISGIKKSVKILNYKFSPDESELGEAIELLNKWLLEKSKRITGKTNLEALAIFWNANNPENEL